MGINWGACVLVALLRRLMSSQNVDVVRQAFAALNRGDLQAALAVIAEDAVLIPLRAATEGVIAGTRACAHSLQITRRHLNSFAGTSANYAT